jgi:hypothetical protein
MFRAYGGAMHFYRNTYGHGRRSDGAPTDLFPFTEESDATRSIGSQSWTGGIR